MPSNSMYSITCTTPSFKYLKREYYFVNTGTHCVHGFMEQLILI